MQVDDRPQLTKVWLVNGPGPDAVWPLSLDGRYAAKRGEWYFPKRTTPSDILRAAGGATSDGSGVASFDAAAEAEVLAGETNGQHEYHAADAGADGELFDPLIEELDADQADGQEPES